MGRKMTAIATSSAMTSDVGRVTQTNAQNSAENPEDLERQLEFLNHYQHCARSRKERLEELMARRSAKSWDAAKKAKMVRRLVRSNQELEQSVGAIDEIERKLVQLRAVAENTFVPGASAVKL